MAKKMPPKRYYDCVRYASCLKRAAIRDEAALYCDDCSRYKKTSAVTKKLKSENGVIKDENRWYVSFDTIEASFGKGGIYAK